MGGRGGASGPLPTSRPPVRPAPHHPPSGRGPAVRPPLQPATAPNFLLRLFPQDEVGVFLLGRLKPAGRRRPGSSRRGGRPKPLPTYTSPRHRRPHPHPGRGNGGRARQPRSRALAAEVPDGLAAGPGRWAREMGARAGAAGIRRAESASGTTRARLGQGERSPGAPQAPPFFAPPGDSCLGPRLPAPSDRGTGRGGVTGRSGVRSSRGAPARHPERPEWGPRGAPLYIANFRSQIK